MSTSTTLSPQEAHHHSLISLIVAGILAFFVGLTFWFVSQNKPAPVYTVNNQDTIRAEVASLLENAKTKATQTEIDRVAATLTKNRVVVTPTERAKISAVLESY